MQYAVRFRYHSGMNSDDDLLPEIVLPEIRSRSRQERVGECPCCRRELRLTFHHLIPKKLHRRSRFRKDFSRDELNRGIDVCRQCHDGIHRRYDEMELFRRFREPAELLADPELRKYFDWVGRQRVRI